MLKEFKDFAMKGSLVDIAVAFVMGAAFNKVVASFTGGIVSPLIGLIFNSDLKELFRHVIEHYLCFINQIACGVFCYDKRKRDQSLEQNRAYAIKAIQKLIIELMKLNLVASKLEGICG